jgi:hypothetical protein
MPACCARPRGIADNPTTIANNQKTVVRLPRRGVHGHEHEHMKSLGILAVILLSVPSPQAWSHPMMGAITWNRQVSRIVYARCVGCHRDGGSAFSLLEYGEARGAAEAIKQAVLSRSMPPWGAVKGFGTLRDEQGLDQAQIEMIVDWADTGTARGNNPRALPERPRPVDRPAFEPPRNAVPVSGDLTLDRPLRLAGLYPRDVAPSASLQIVAAMPDGRVAPLVWLYGYRQEYAHAFWLENTLELPAGTVIRGVPAGASVLLIPARR